VKLLKIFVYLYITDKNILIGICEGDFIQFEIDKLGDLRRKLNLTQKELAALAGVSQSLIAKIEARKIDPAYSKVVAIFHAIEDQLNKHKHTKKASEVMTKDIISIKPDDKLDKVMKIMRERAISQLPVLKEGKPIGSVTDDEFVDWLTKYGDKISKVSVRYVMKESFPIIPENSEIEVVTEMLKFYKALLVKRDGDVVGIITKSDLIKAMRS